MSSSATNKEESRRRARKGIPAYIVIPASNLQDYDDDDESLSSLEGYPYSDHTDRIIRTPSIKLRTQSLPTCLSRAQKEEMIEGSDRTRAGDLEDSITIDDCGSIMMSNTGTDRPPKVPLRRRSLHSSNHSVPRMSKISIPLPLRGSSRPRTSIRRALAA